MSTTERAIFAARPLRGDERRILALTPAQQKALETYRDQWRSLHTEVRPTDKAAADEAMRALYRQAGLPEPRVIYWYGSPAEMLADQQHRSFAQGAGEDVWHSVGGLLGDRVWRTLWGRVSVGVGASVWGETRVAEPWVHAVSHYSLDPQPGGAAPYTELPYWQGNDLGAVEHAAGIEVVARQDAQTRNGRTGEVFTEVSWVSELLPAAAFFHEVVGVEELGEIGPLLRLSQSAGPWIACEHAARICERPTVFALDDQGRLHCEDGPAFAYRTSEPFYAWHGVKVPGEVIVKPASLTIEAILSERNAEVRRVMIERYGLERFLADGGARLRDESRYGRLWHSRTTRFSPQWLELKNSTPELDGTHKTYILTVPPYLETAHAAVAWTFGMRPENYRIAAES